MLSTVSVLRLSVNAHLSLSLSSHPHAAHENAGNIFDPSHWLFCFSLTASGTACVCLLLTASGTTWSVCDAGIGSGAPSAVLHESRRAVEVHWLKNEGRRVIDLDLGSTAQSSSRRHGRGRARQSAPLNEGNAANVAL